MRLRIVAALALGLAVSVTACKKEESETTEQAANTNETSAGATKVRRPAPFQSFVDWDRNNDNEVTRSEFQKALGEKSVLDDWDADDDGELTDVEFETAFYKAWDINGDGKVDVHEYKDGSGAYFPSANAFGSFEDVDADGDDELSISEFEAVSDKVYQDWDGDGDGELVDKEFQTALYDAWDLNGDGVIDHEEYRWN